MARITQGSRVKVNNELLSINGQYGIVLKMDNTGCIVQVEGRTYFLFMHELISEYDDKILEDIILDHIVNSDG